MTQPLSGRRLASYYIRGSGGKDVGSESSALVRVWVWDELDATTRAHLATEEAEEQGCMPGGTCLVYEVVPQDESFYNKLITEAEAERMRNDPAIMALVR